MVYVMFALWRLSDILKNELGGNTVAAEFTLFIKTRQVRGARASRITRAFLSLSPVSTYQLYRFLQVGGHRCPASEKRATAPVPSQLQ